MRILFYVILLLVILVLLIPADPPKVVKSIMTMEEGQLLADEMHRITSAAVYETQYFILNKPGMPKWWIPLFMSK